MSQTKDGWGSRLGLILAMAGNAVGLGNFLRFPVQAVQNGGGAFLIPYLVSFLLMGIPLLWVEWSMGRYGGKFGSHSTPFILDSMSKKRWWKYIGVFAIFTNLGILSYYTYIESWTLTYTFKSISGAFTDLEREQVSSLFDTYIGTNGTLTDNILGINIPFWALLAFLVTLSLNVFILSRGLRGGIEKVAKIAMPMLLIFGVFLAVRAITLGDTHIEGCTSCDTHKGLNFLWAPEFDSLSNPKVWLAAAGQIFFTLSVGMGTIQCYAAYLKPKEDIALNAMTAGWTNAFVEIVLGASIVIPISVGYMGLDWVKDNAGFMMAFKTMPYLFNQWQPYLAALSGLAWFGLLFIAGITSSLAMGTPWMGFVEDEFGWKRNKSALILGFIILLMALPPILFFEYGVFDEYDYWTGTVALVVFALAEVILFSWVFGIEKGWQEITGGADIRIPTIYRFIIKWVTPFFIMIIFISSLIKPLNGDMEDWATAFTQLFEHGSWPWADDSIIAQIFHLNVDISWFNEEGPTAMFFKDLSRGVLLATLLGLTVMVRKASNRRKRNKLPTP